MKCTFTGSYVALPTPFRDGELDLPALAGLVDFHVEHGSDGLVVAGTSGEAATLSDYERQSAFEAVVERAAGRLPVIAGVGTNDTAHSVQLARAATAARVDGLLAVTPYYNKPSPRGMVLHYGAIAEASPLPLVLYNVPSRTGVDLKPDTIAEIRRKHPNVVAIKEASGSVARSRQILDSSDIAVIIGEDGLIAELMGIGAIGVIGVVANVAPRQVAELVRVAAPGGDPVRAAELSDWLRPLVRDLFIESNPAPLKAAMAAMGLCSDELRLPLAPLVPENKAQLLATLSEAGVAAAAAR
jgi:4-hydroxy-tetrahydrodipicolinate synthase